MNFGDLIDATNMARRDSDIVVRVGGKELALKDVSVSTVDLDDGKKLGDTAEGHSHEDSVVYLDAG